MNHEDNISVEVELKKGTKCLIDRSEFLTITEQRTKSSDIVNLCRSHPLEMMNFEGERRSTRSSSSRNIRCCLATARYNSSKYDDNNNNDRLMEYVVFSNRTDDPLSVPEVTMNLNEGSPQLPVYPIEEPEEDMFDYETDTSIQDTNTESEEQVVPSSQLSSSYKYPEELTISDDEVDEGIFEDEPASNLVLPNDDNTYNSQPP